MSRVTELAEAESTIAESEPEPEPEEETETTEEPEPEPEPAAPVATEQDIAKAMSKLEREAARHAKQVEGILGAEWANVIPCPMCFTPGFTYPMMGGLVDDDQLQRMRQVIGIASEPQYLAAEDAERCDKCAGWGVVLTGAQNTPNLTKPCSGCGGTGWKQRMPPPVLVPPLASPPSPTLANVSGGVYVPPGAPQPVYNYSTGQWENSAG